MAGINAEAEQRKQSREYEALRTRLRQTEQQLTNETEKICHPAKPHCTITSCADGLYRNQMLCERLAGRAGILLVIVFA